VLRARAAFSGAKGHSIRVGVSLVAVLSIWAMMSVHPPFAFALPSFSSSGWDGGNYQNVVAIAGDSDTVVAGGDMSGLHRLPAWGSSWVGVNNGLTVPGQLGRSPSFSIASILFKPNSDTIYVGAGQGANFPAGFYVSINDGESWTRRSETPIFTAGPSGGGAGEVTRSVGNLLAYYDVGPQGTLLAATRAGLLRSTNGGTDWVLLGAESESFRGLAVDPNVQGTIYLASTGHGVFKAVDVIDCTAPCMVNPMANSPMNPEEIVSIDDGTVTSVFVAAGADGVYRWRSNGGTQWDAMINGLPVHPPGGPPLWVSLAGHGSGSTATLYVGAQNPVDDDGDSTFDAIFKTTNAGGLWTSVTDSGVTGTICESFPARTWWAHTADNEFMLGERDYVANQIVIDPSDTNRIVVAGRSGLWSSDDDGTEWCPLVNGLMVAQARDIVVDRNPDPDQFYMGSADFAFLHSINGLQTVKRQPICPPGGGCGSNVSDIALDTSETPYSTVYVANGDDDQTNWDIYSNPNPADPDTVWSDLQLGLLSGGNVPSGIAVRQVGGSPVIVVGVAQAPQFGNKGGIWRYSGESWLQVKPGLMQDGNLRASATWLSNPTSSIVYFYDPSSGLWRSNNNGAQDSWHQVIWNTGLQGLQGFLAADPFDLNRLYLSIEGQGAWVIEDADDPALDCDPLPGDCRPIGAGVFSKPGPITVGRNQVSCPPEGEPCGDVYVTQYLTHGTPSRIWGSTNGGNTWTEWTDTYYEGSGYNPVNLVATGGKVYVAVASGAVIIGTQ